ncbi:MAG: hypothetical protein IJA59_10330 [Clostridia bacterium]|nr:hypothetical protein [Clostridia bacterium]
MKRLLLTAFSCLIIFTLLGCSAKKASALEMYIEPAQLSKEEQAIVNLLDASRARIFDFKLTDELKSAHIKVYRLEDGAWVPASGGGSLRIEGKKSRLALDFDVLADDLYVALQGTESSAVKRIAPEKMDRGKMSVTTTSLANRTEMQYEQEVPLIVQIISEKDVIMSYGPEIFSDPARLQQYGYEYVYAVTVMFSKNPL